MHIVSMPNKCGPIWDVKCFYIKKINENYTVSFFDIYSTYFPRYFFQLELQYLAVEWYRCSHVCCFFLNLFPVSKKELIVTFWHEEKYITLAAIIVTFLIFHW